MTIMQKIWPRLRGAVMVLVLALGGLSAPLSMATWELDVCEMECCIAEGHCCCATRHAYVKGREPKPGDISLTIESSLTSCLAACPASGVSAKKNILRAAQSHAPLLTPPFKAQEGFRLPLPLYHQFAAQPSSPRAPPSRDGLLA
jgi:hypothetical protein